MRALFEQFRLLLALKFLHLALRAIPVTHPAAANLVTCIGDFSAREQARLQRTKDKS